MRPNQRPRTGQRRDGGVRVIRTEYVRYPGHEHPLIDEIDDGSMGSGGAGGRSTPPAPDDPNAPGGTRLRVRDTGLALEGRAARSERLRARSRRRTVMIGVAVAAALLLAVIGWRYASDKRAASLPLDASSSSSAANGPLGAAHAQASTTGATFRAVAPDPTPIFASYGRLKLRLPVETKRLSEIGFHQASYPWAMRMKTPLKDAANADVRGKRGTGRETSTQPTGADAVLVGKVIRMWRNRPGKPDTAADVGAKPGSAVMSPVTGTVVKIKSYKLYGKWADYEMHITPDGFDNIDIVMIHIAEPTVKVGQRVDAGVTRVGAVRKLSDKMTDQLAQYVKDGGDHVHLQVNNANYPGYKGLDGAVEPEEPTATTDTGGY